MLKGETRLNANKLTINYAKTKYLLIKPNTNSSQLCKFTLTIKGIELYKCQSAKYLGIILDENLTWEPHIQYQEKNWYYCKRVNLKQLVLLQKQSVYFTKNSGYRSLKNRSCITVFGSCSATLTVGESLGDVSDSANHDFRTSVTEISGEIDASLQKCAIISTTKT